MKPIRIVVPLIIASLLAACTSTVGHRNFVAAMPIDRICTLRFGRWCFMDDPTYPHPIAINPVIYFDTDDEEDLNRILPLVIQLRETDMGDFIPTCGQLTQIALLDHNSRWVGEVSINACSDGVSLYDDSLRPRKSVHAYSYNLALEAFRTMKRHRPELVEQMVHESESIRVRFTAAVSNAPNLRVERTVDKPTVRAGNDN